MIAHVTQNKDGSGRLNLQTMQFVIEDENTMTKHLHYRQANRKKFKKKTTKPNQ